MPKCSHEVSACRRHVQHQSFEALVNNQGAGGAIAGLAQQALAIAEQQVPHSAPSGGRAGLHGAVSGSGTFGPRSRSDVSSSSGNLDQQVKQLTHRMQMLMKVVNQHDRDLRELEAWSCHTFRSVLGKRY